MSSTKRDKASRGASDSQSTKRLKTEDGFVIPALPNSVKEEDDGEEDINLDLDDIDEDDADPHSASLITNHLKLLSILQHTILEGNKTRCLLRSLLQISTRAQVIDIRLLTSINFGSFCYAYTPVRLCQ